MDRVYDGLYIGDIRTLQNQNEIKEEGITAVVRLDMGAGQAGQQQWSTDAFAVLKAPFLDGDWIPDDVIVKVTSFIHEQLEDDGVVLVHCAMGVSRSVTLTMAYLIEYEGMSLAEAFGTVREGRTQAYPHPKLLASLIEHYDLPFDPMDAFHPHFMRRLMQDV